jgi:hypothetical protein
VLKISQQLKTLREAYVVTKLFTFPWKSTAQKLASIHVAPAISWLRVLLLVVTVAGRWPVSFRSVKSHFDMLANISWYFVLSLTKHGNHYSLAFPGDSFTTSFKTWSQATVLSFSQPRGYRMYRQL